MHQSSQCSDFVQYRALIFKLKESHIEHPIGMLISLSLDAFSYFLIIAKSTGVRLNEKRTFYVFYD